MTRDEIRELADFQADEANKACALSFYFQPDPPQDRSHRHEAIVAKDIVKEALKSAAASGKNGSVHADLDRVLDVATHLRSSMKAKAIFACSAQNFWREYELPPRLGGTHIYLKSRFHLKPLAALLGAQPKLCVALVDRQRARFLDLRLDNLRERGAMVHKLPRTATSYGFNGYNAGHAERHVEKGALQHFKLVSDRLLAEYEQGVWERLIVGCHDVNWPDLEPNLHPYAKQRLIGRFSVDVASVTNEEIRDHANVILDQWITDRASTKASQALDLARGNGLGVAGLRRVLLSLEAGEVQSILLGENYSSPAVRCPNCGHLDAHLVAACAACGHATSELTDVCDAIIPMAIRSDIELFYLREHPDLDRAGNIAALLRFRSDVNRTGQGAA